MNEHQKYINRYSKNINHSGEISKYFLEETGATGTIIRCELGKGIEMLFFDYHVSKDQIMKGFENGNLLEIFYCLHGKIEMKYGENAVLLEDNKIGIYDFNSCPEEVKLKKGSIKGISLLLDVCEAEDIIKQYFHTNPMILNQMKEAVSNRKELFLTFGNSNLRSIFLGIAEAPFDYDKEYLLLKALELIWMSNHHLAENTKGSRAILKKGSRYRMFEKAVAYMEYSMDRECLLEHTCSAEYMDSIDRVCSTKELSAKMGVTQKECNQLFMEYANLSAFAYQKEMRLNKARDCLIQTEKPITEIAGEVGWMNASKFSDAFKKRYGLTPTEYRKENKLI